jgi:anti-sigma regulatory factor (Ser/Thr protein kinase)
VSRPPTLRRSHRQAQGTASDEAITALPESGRGMAIMKACVDDVTMSSGPESGTVVSLQKRIAWRNDAPLANLAGEQLREVG